MEFEGLCINLGGNRPSPAFKGLGNGAVDMYQIADDAQAEEQTGKHTELQQAQPPSGFPRLFPPSPAAFTGAFAFSQARPRSLSSVQAGYFAIKHVGFNGNLMNILFLLKFLEADKLLSFKRYSL